MSNQGGNADVKPTTDSLDKFDKRLPIPLHTLSEGFMRHLLDLIKHAHQLHAVFGLKWRKRRRAVARNNGRHPMLNSRLCRAILQQLRVEMGVGIDETRGHYRRPPCHS